MAITPRPARAKTSAMPAPMVPRPTTATWLISMAARLQPGPPRDFWPGRPGARRPGPIRKATQRVLLQNAAPASSGMFCHANRSPGAYVRVIFGTRERKRQRMTREAPEWLTRSEGDLRKLETVCQGAPYDTEL